MKAYFSHSAQLRRQATDLGKIFPARVQRIAKLLYPIIQSLATHPDPLGHRCHTVTALGDPHHRLALELFCISDPSRHGPILLASSITL